MDQRMRYRYKRPFSLSARLSSFRFASRGLWTMVWTQHNAWIHALASAAVCSLGFLLKIDEHDWCIVVLGIVSVWTAEALNTAFEFLADVASPDFHPLVEKAKDVAAGAVLISAIGAAIVGIIIFWPHLSVLW